MTERRMMVSIGYDQYIGDPADIAALISIGPRLTRVDHSHDYKSMVLHKDNRYLVQAVSFVQIDYSLPIEPQPNAAVPNAIEPAPASEPTAEFRMTNETASWEDWLKQVNSLPGGSRVLASDLAGYFADGKTPSEAIDDAIPF